MRMVSRARTPTTTAKGEGECENQKAPKRSASCPAGGAAS